MTEETLYFSSDHIRIEARLAYNDSIQAPNAKVLLCSPHPFLGGDMDNNVLRQIKKNLVMNDFVVFRFNYRGIGMSGTDRDLHEDQKLFWENSTCPAYEENIYIDCQHAYTILADIMETEWPVYIVGYSFGCLPAMQIAKKQKIMKLGLISPPLGKWQIKVDDLDFKQQKKFFHAPDDFACPEYEMQELYRDAAEPKSIQSFPDADHFFIGKEMELAKAVTEFLLT